MTLKLLLSEGDIINAISDMRVEGITTLSCADGGYNFYINLQVDGKINADETKNAIGRKFTDLVECRIVWPTGGRYNEYMTLSENIAIHSAAEIMLRFCKKGIA
jgi:hypothetical protein